MVFNILDAVNIIPGYHGQLPSHTSVTSIGSHDVINGRYVTSQDDEDSNFMYNIETRYNFYKFGGKGKMPSRFRGRISFHFLVNTATYWTYIFQA